jgi:hypothetical protein
MRFSNRRGRRSVDLPFPTHSESSCGLAPIRYGLSRRNILAQIGSHLDGRSCQLLPLANVKSEAPLSEQFTVSDLELPGSLVPA